MMCEWWDQLGRDCPKDRTPVIFNKANGKEILAIMKLEDWKKAEAFKTTNSALIDVSASIDMAGLLSEAALKLKAWNEIYLIPHKGIDVSYWLIKEDPINIFVFMKGLEWLKIFKKEPIAIEAAGITNAIDIDDINKHNKETFIDFNEPITPFRVDLTKKSDPIKDIP